MAHVTSRSYLKLQERLEKSPQGAPASDSLFQILEILFTEEEAELVSRLPIKPLSVERAATIWKKDVDAAREILDGLAEKGLILDLSNGTEKRYILAPTMAGFFEFSIMRTDGRFDKKLLSELFHQYINEEELFLNAVLALDPAIARTFVHETAVRPQYQSMILDYERSTQVIETATHIAVGTCYCRHKMEHVGKACDNPQEVCLTFNTCARSLAEHGVARSISKDEARKILDDCIDRGLVQVGDNVQEGVGFICNCCGCCCEALLAYKRLGHMKVHTNFYAEVIEENCTGCGKCAKACPVDEIEMVKNADGTMTARVNIDRCIGCGVCTRKCQKDALVLERREETAFVPKDSFERFVMSAINTGKLQNLIFDNFGLWTNEVMRRFLGFLLRLGPVKRRLATQQLQSRFIHNLANSHFARNKLSGLDAVPDYTHPELDR